MTTRLWAFPFACPPFPFCYTDLGESESLPSFFPEESQDRNPSPLQPGNTWTSRCTSRPGASWRTTSQADSERELHRDRGRGPPPTVAAGPSAAG